MKIEDEKQIMKNRELKEKLKREMKSKSN